MPRAIPPRRFVLKPRDLARAAWLVGRGFPLAHVASQLTVDRRHLETELSRLGLPKAMIQPAEGPPTVVVEFHLTQNERAALGRSAIKREMYTPAVIRKMVQTVLREGPEFVDAILDDGGAR